LYLTGLHRVEIEDISEETFPFRSEATEKPEDASIKAA